MLVLNSGLLLLVAIVVSVSLFTAYFIPSWWASFDSVSHHIERKVGYIVFLLSTLVLGKCFRKHDVGQLPLLTPRTANILICLVMFGLFVFTVVYEKIVASIAGCLVVTLLLLARRLHRRSVFLMVLSVTCMSMLLLNALPLLHGFQDLSSQSPYPDTLAVRETHTAFILTGPAQQILSGNLFVSTTSSYGVVLQSFLAIIQKVRGSWDWGLVLYFIGAAQVVFLLLSSLAYFKYAGVCKAAWLFATLLLVPCLPTVGNPVFIVNLSSVRFLGFGLAAIFLVLAPQHLPPVRKAVVGGFVSGIACLTNIESGVCIIVGLLFFTLSAVDKCWRKILKLGVIQTLGFLLALISFELVYGLSFGYYPGVAGWFRFFLSPLENFLVGQSAHDGASLFPLLFLISVHSSYCLIVLCRKQHLSRRETVKLSIVLMLVLWLVYLFNNAVIQHTNSIWFLYLFLVIDEVRLMSCRWTSLNGVSKVVLLTTLTCVSISSVPPITGFIERFGRAYAFNINRYEKSQVLSGVLLPSSWAAEISIRAAMINEESQKGRVFYITMNPVLIPSVSGVPSEVPFREFYFSMLRKGAFERLNSFLERHSERVLIDDPQILLSGDIHKKCTLEMIRLRLGTRFELLERKNGWEIWVKKAATQI